MYQVVESVCKGHPDKVCDQIVDAIIDYIYNYHYEEESGYGYIRLDCMMSNNSIKVTGVISQMYEYISIYPPIDATLLDCGYSAEDFDIEVNVEYTDYENAIGDKYGRGIGYAIRETDEYMPYSIMLAHSICKNLDEINSPISKLCPRYGKVQIVAEYDSEYNFLGITDIYVKKLFIPTSDQATRVALIKGCIQKSAQLLGLNIKNTNIEIETIDRLEPSNMIGMSGRKIPVDMYGDYLPITGGALSGKDMKQSDRLLNYFARYIAKYILNKCPTLQESVIDIFFSNGNYRVYMQDTPLVDLGFLPNFDIYTFYNSIKDTYYKPTSCYGAFGYSEYPWEDIYAED